MTKNNNLPLSLLETKKITPQARIVAIGASAGGLEALRDFFENIRENDNNAYVIVQHLSPDYKSMMGKLLHKSTSLPILEIHEGMTIEPGHIYLVPSVNNLGLTENRFHLSDKPYSNTLNLPIDLFFESLAQSKKDKAIGVILSGTGSDGTRGLKAIKENGGMIMVQDPEQAKFDGMPRNAINSGLVDYILPVEKMGGELRNFISAPAIFHFKDGDVSYNQTELMKILHFVDTKTGLDFKEYKHSTLARRVARRINVCNCTSLEEYYNYLKSDKEEVEILYHEFLIGATKFFRDNKVWKALSEKVIPVLVSEIKNGETLKVWDVGCSTGEEAYSLAMCINEEIDRQGKNIDLKIFATDISEKHLDTGSKGRYPESIVADISRKLLAKYFVVESKGYQVIEKLRKKVVFSKHNLIKNPPLSNMDLVVCRNLLIYFQPKIQQDALHVLHYALKPDRFLLLGTSEEVQDGKENFEEIDRKWKIYKNIRPSTRLQSSLSHSASKNLIENRSYRERKNPRNSIGKTAKQKLRNELHESLLEQFGGASVFIDFQCNILEAVGEFRKYANLPESGFSTNLMDMLEPDLKYIIQTSLKKAQIQNEKIHYKNGVFLHNGEQKGVDIIVKPLKQHNPEGDVNFVVIFIEKEINLKDVKTVDNIAFTKRTKEYVNNLEEELKTAKEELQHSLEEIERNNEELQEANEELLASNEELQSTNEELQSVNEEINTINAENLQKMEDLSSLNLDMNNLLESTQIGTVFLDSSLNIRKFTPAIKQHFDLISTDIGRPLEHFTASMGKNNLLKRCKRVLTTGKILEKDVVAKDGITYLRRISPYINSEKEIEGVVLTFIDIEMLQRSKEKLLASEKRFKSFYEDDPIMHISVDPKSSEIVQCNKMAVKSLEYNTKDELIGLPIFDLYSEEAQIKALKSNKVFQKTGELVNLEQNMLTKTGKILPVILNATAEKDEADNVMTIRYTCVDISAIKKAAEQLKKQKADLERANGDLEQFVSICSHDLQEPLSTIKFGIDVLGKIYADKLDQKGKNYITHIEESSNRLSSQIKALLEHSRIGRDGDKVLVNTKELVEVVKYDLGKSIKDTKAKIHTGELPEIKGYEVELRLMFQNLISNAIKYTPPARNPEVRISAFKEGKYWVFTITDNGMGISKEDQENIFTIFNRVQGNEKIDGTGVGLAHVKKVVLLHEGSIWVDSQPGVGSTFYFKLKA